MGILWSYRSSSTIANQDEITPLFMAAQEGRTEVVAQLLAAGAEVARTTDGALLIAAQEGCSSSTIARSRSIKMK